MTKNIYTDRTYTKNIYSVKATIRPYGRSKNIDGPWKPTVELAVDAFAEMLYKKEWNLCTVFYPFVAKRTDTGGATDVRGISYDDMPEQKDDLILALKKQNILTSI